MKYIFVYLAKAMLWVISLFVGVGLALWHWEIQHLKFWENDIRSFNENDLRPCLCICLMFLAWFLLNVVLFIAGFIGVKLFVTSAVGVIIFLIAAVKESENY